MSGKYITYRKFRNREEAADFFELLDANNITYSVVNNSPAIDITFSLNSLQDQIEIKLQKDDFRIVDALLEKKAESEIHLIDKEYYLFDFSDEELMEVLEKPDEWTREDQVRAKYILKQRGKSINEPRLREAKQARLVQLHRPEKAGTLLVVLGFLFAIVGGIIPFWLEGIIIYLFQFTGMAIGITLLVFTKSDYEGNRYHVFDRRSRRAGSVMFILSLASLIFGYYFYLNY